MKANSKNIKRLDEAIEKTMVDMESKYLSYDEMEALNARLETLTDARTKLYDSLKKNSIRPSLVTGGFGIGAILLVLYYEKTEIVTSKAFSAAMRMLEG